LQQSEASGFGDEYFPVLRHLIDPS